ncbi:MAG: polysaccharide pyruvyl transferase family protein [Bacteroidales bacterium]|nr:polysaccharide pyruvyl transferase family protein [Bacteroidales bacterium]
MLRRDFIRYSGFSFLSAFLRPGIEPVKTIFSKKPVILVVSGWQDVNIGDIAHTPGLLNILQTYLPEARLILWKRSKSEIVGDLLARNFPAVKVIYGDVSADKSTDSSEVNFAMREADLMIHGSGPSLVGADNLACWVKNTARPFGVFGVTLQNPGEYHLDLLRKASFIFTRETISINHLKKAGITGSHIAFAPDATFFLDIHDDEKALRFLGERGLEDKKFICVVPRLRYTPYHLFNPNNNGWDEKRIRLVEETNMKYKEADHAKMREAMIAWVRNKGNKVLVCPEMTYQVDIMDELLIDPLPADVKPFVLKRGYCLPDEAASVYRRAHSVISFECHSPIIAAANSTPMIYLRQPEDTIKGQMYYDLGFDDWIFDLRSMTVRGA